MKTIFTVSSGPSSIELAFEGELPQPGTTLVVKVPLSTKAGVMYLPGDELELLERTDAAPHGVKCSLGNWRVKCKHFTSIWSNIEWSMINELLEVKQ